MWSGLVDGRKIFVDSSLVDADASNNSVIDTRSLKVQLQEGYKKLEARLEEKSESTDSSRRYVKENSRYVSTTDPDASIVNRASPNCTILGSGPAGRQGHGHELSLDTSPLLIEELIGMAERIKEKSYSPIDSWLDSRPWKKGRRIGLTGLAGSSKAYLLSHWREKVRGPLLVIVPHLRGAEVFLEDLRFFMRGSEVPSFLFPQWESLPYDEIPPHPEIIRERVRVLFSLLKGEEPVIISSIKALMQKVLAPADLRESVFSLSWERRSTATD